MAIESKNAAMTDCLISRGPSFDTVFGIETTFLSIARKNLFRRRRGGDANFDGNDFGKEEDNGNNSALEEVVVHREGIEF